MASTAGPAQPCDADSLSVLEADDVVGYRDHLADDLVPGDRVWCLRCKIAFGQVQVGSAHGTYQDAYQNLAKAQLRYRPRVCRARVRVLRSWTTHAAMSSGRSCRTGTEASIALTISARRPGYADRVAKDSSKNTDGRSGCHVSHTRKSCSAYKPNW